MDRDVERQPAPGIERRDHICDVGLDRLGRVGLKQRPRKHLINLNLAANDGNVSEESGRVELAAEREVGVHENIAQFVLKNLEALRRDIDFEVADAQLARAEAPSNLERFAVPVFQMEGRDSEAIVAEFERDVAILVAGAGRNDLKAGPGELDRSGDRCQW